MEWIWSVLLFLILLACPLMHIVMHKKMGHEHGGGGCCGGKNDKNHHAESELSELRKENQMLKNEMNTIKSLMEDR